MRTPTCTAVQFNLGVGDLLSGGAHWCPVVYESSKMSLMKVSGSLSVRPSPGEHLILDATARSLSEDFMSGVIPSSETMVSCCRLT